MTDVLRARESDLSSQDIDGTTMLLDERTWRYLHLNETGAVLWKHLVEGSSEAGLRQALVAAYEIDESVAQADVDAFLADLRARDLLVTDTE